MMSPLNTFPPASPIGVVYLYLFHQLPFSWRPLLQIDIPHYSLHLTTVSSLTVSASCLTPLRAPLPHYLPLLSMINAWFGNKSFILNHLLYIESMDFIFWLKYGSRICDRALSCRLLFYQYSLVYSCGGGLAVVYRTELNCGCVNR